MNNIGKIFVIITMFMSIENTEARNLIRNGNFTKAGEEGTPSGWENSSWGDMVASFTYPAPGWKGGNDKGVGITILSANTEVDDRGASWRTAERIPVSEGQQFIYTDWTSGDIQSYLDVEFEMWNGELFYQPLKATLQTGMLWKKTVTRIMAPRDAAAMSVYRVAKDAGSLVLDKVSLTPIATPATASGFVTFSFDDGLSQKDVPALLKRLKIPGTFYINPTAVNFYWDPAYFTPEEVSALAADGNEVGNHSGQHLHLTELSESDLHTEIVEAKNDLEEMIGGSVSTFAYPYGEYTQMVIDLVSEHHVAARGVEAGSGIDAGINAPTQDRYALHADCIENTTSVDEVKTIIDRASETDQWLILCFHQFDQSGTWSYQLSDLKKIIKYAKKKTQIITVQEGELSYLQ